MKRIFALVVVLVMTFSLVGCAEAAKDALNRDLSRGTVDGNTYSSEFLGISFVKPDSWVYSTDEEINEMMGVSNDITNRTDYEAAVADLLTVFDMMVIDYNSGNNVNVVFENLSLSNSTDITEDEYIEITKTNLQAVADLSYTFADVETVSLGGVEFKRLTCDVSYMELVSMKQVMYMKKIDNYMALISFTIVDGTDTSVIEGYFAENK